MGGLGGNLNYKDRPLLITNLTVADFGVYLETNPDTGGTTKHLVVKKIGLDIPYNSSAVIRQSNTMEGALKSVLLSINAPCPCQDCNYEYGIEIVRKVKNPGVLNDVISPRRRFYGGNIETIGTCSNGEMSDADKLTMEDEILNQILLDRGLGTREEAIVDGRRLYLITVAAANDQRLTITDADGDETITMDTGSTALTIANDINSNTKGLYAFAISTTRIAITSSAVGKLFTLADGGGAGTITVFDRYLWITSRSVDDQFEVAFENGFLTLTRFNMLKLTNAYTAGNLKIAVGGTATANIAGNAASATFAGSINTAIGNASITGVYASYNNQGSIEDIYIYSGVQELKVKTLNTGVTVAVQYSGGGVYPAMNWEEVFREFAQASGNNGLSHLVPLTQPAEGDKYCKLTIEITNTIGSEHGANYGNSYKQVQTIYIKQGKGSDHLWHDPATSAASGMWESTADSGTFSATKDINDLIAWWSGSAVTTAVL